ncbi:MAG: Xaa-Pro aminopeptidase [Halieaceae bacterium]|jgi:Xaa-Pro aminopeptidase
MSITRQEFARRRRNLMAEFEPNSIAILPSASEKIRNGDVEYSFRQDSDFFYVSGFDEPDAVIVFLPGRSHGEFVIFCREREAEKELWLGEIAGPERVCANFDADDAFPIGDIDDILPGLIEGRDRLYYAMGRNTRFDKRVMAWVNGIRLQERKGAHPPGELLDLDHILHDMRLYKSAAELKLMREAASISARAHTRAMKRCQPGLMEYQLEAELVHEFLDSGCRSSAYSSIVGGGANACVMHYVENRDRLKSGDLVLIDAGCELHKYAADVTRTFPVNGRFSVEQAQLYEIVHDAWRAAVTEVRPGNHWNEPHDASVMVITAGLVELGLLQGNVDELIEQRAYQPFYMHKVGHWLGMDVHDVGDYRVGEEWRVLEPSMVMTIEPGIYISPENTSVAKKWRGIGIRIEDDVVVTKTGCEILSDAVPRSREAIEALMAA